MLLVLLAASWLCCDASDEKSRLLRRLLSGYEKDVEPPLPAGVSNTTVGISVDLHCATPVDDFVTIESWTIMVRIIVSVGLNSANAVLVTPDTRSRNRRRKSIPFYGAGFWNVLHGYRHYFSCCLA